MGFIMSVCLKCRELDTDYETGKSEKHGFTMVDCS